MREFLRGIQEPSRWKLRDRGAPARFPLVRHRCSADHHQDGLAVLLGQRLLDQGAQQAVLHQHVVRQVQHLQTQREPIGPIGLADDVAVQGLDLLGRQPPSIL